MEHMGNVEYVENVQNAEEVKALSELLEKASKVVSEAAELALHPDRLESVRDHGGLAVETKANRNDLVTLVDKGIEDYVAKRLGMFSEYPLVGEESHSVDSYDGRVWVLDPIDGTMNYVATHRDYAISLALCEDGQPILAVICDVVANKMYTAIKGQGAFCDGAKLTAVPADTVYTDTVLITDLKEILAMPRLVEALKNSRGHRRYGSAALECLEVAAGRAGGFIHMWVSPWDIAAVKLVCEETGVLVTRLDGTYLDVRSKGSILAAWPKAHEGLLDTIMIRNC